MRSKVIGPRPNSTTETVDDARGGTPVQSPTVAFTLLELLVVIAIIGLLAGLLLPVLAKAKEKGRQVRCLSNFKQIGMAFQLYLEENREQFPAPGSRTSYGPLPEDWIHWQNNRNPNQSAIAPFLANAFPTNLFRCPTDKVAWRLEQTAASTNPYVFSYTLAAHRVVSNTNPGLALALDSRGHRIPFYSNSVRNPSGKIMLAEEDRSAVNDARWIPASNPLTARHNGRGNVAFIDGRAEAVTPAFARNPVNSLAGH